MKILLFVFALWAFMSIAPTDGKNVLRHYGRVCPKGKHWIVKIKCTNKCKVRNPKAAFKKGEVSISGRFGKVFRQKTKSCGRNCFCINRKKIWNQVFCKKNKSKKIKSDKVYFDIWCIKQTTKLRFRAYIRNIKLKMMKPVKKCPSGQNRHEDGECRECENKQYKNGTCMPCDCSVRGSKFLSCETTSGQCKCKAGYKDRDCNNCEVNYYRNSGTNGCVACGCNNVGTRNGGQCGRNGRCVCDYVNYKGHKCDQCQSAQKNKHEDGVCRECKSGKYKNGQVCSACGCNTANTKGNFDTCDNRGQCFCASGTGLKCA